MNRLRIATRLSLLIGSLSALLIAIGTLGLLGLDKSNETFRATYLDRTVPLMQLGRIQYLQIRNRLAIANSIIVATPEAVARNLPEIEANIGEISKLWDGYMTTSLTVEEARIAHAFAEARQQFVQQGLRASMAALRAGDFEAARRNALEKGVPLFEAAQEQSVKLIQLQMDIAQEDYNANASRYQPIRAVSIAAIVCGLLFALVFGRYLTRGITVPLRRAVDISHAVAQGALDHPIEVDGKDEVAQLMQSLLDMQTQLATVVGAVRSGAESVAAASAQIAEGNHDLSGRTEGQASALEQTAASMEELNSTVGKNAESARQGNQLAQGASAVATQGGEMMARVVDTMKHINDSSKRIYDIISVIDAIAFQTNILALNAAVEAARAGEQGRGFAVVATEVRALAGRSAAAAKEIKGLIQASVERVEHGNVLVEQAGQTMTELVGGIRRVTDIMGEISAASAEQSAGMAQVGEAVTSMDQATQQNAALVEEMASAASSLQQQARELVQKVAVFKLAGHAIAVHAHPAQAAGHPSGPTRPHQKIAAPARAFPALTAAGQEVSRG